MRYLHTHEEMGSLQKYLIEQVQTKIDQCSNDSIALLDKRRQIIVTQTLFLLLDQSGLHELSSQTQTQDGASDKGGTCIQASSIFWLSGENLSFYTYFCLI